MLRLRSIFLALTVILVAPLLGAMGVAAFILWDMPPSQGPRLRAPHEVVGVSARGATMWVVPAGDDEVVIVDSGLVPDAESLLAEVRDRKVLAVLLTHAHLEQVMGLAAFPEVPVYVGEADTALLAGEADPEGWLAGWLSQVMEPPAATGEVHTVADGDVIELGTESFRAVHTPGHTDGHVVWAWRDVLFTGGAVLAGSPLRLMPGPLSNDPEAAKRSLDSLLPFDFDIIADGHTGFVSNARAELHRLLDATLEPPTISLRGPMAPTASAGPHVSETGRLIRAAALGPEGVATTLLVLDDGPQWVLDVGQRDVSDLDGQRVTVNGTLTAPDARPGLPGRLWLDVDGVAVAGTPEDPATPGLPQFRSEAALSESLHRWGVARGTVQSLTPLALGAAFGEGRLVLVDGGGEVPLSAPMTTPVGAQVDLLVRVSEEAGGLWLVAHRLCDDSTPCL